jgi:hypothetical protein
MGPKNHTWVMPIRWVVFWVAISIAGGAAIALLVEHFVGRQTSSSERVAPNASSSERVAPNASSSEVPAANPADCNTTDAAHLDWRHDTAFNESNPLLPPATAAELAYYPLYTTEPLDVAGPSQYYANKHWSRSNGVGATDPCVQYYYDQATKAGLIVDLSASNGRRLDESPSQVMTATNGLPTTKLTPSTNNDDEGFGIYGISWSGSAHTKCFTVNDVPMVLKNFTPSEYVVWPGPTYTIKNWALSFPESSDNYLGVALLQELVADDGLNHPIPGCIPLNYNLAGFGKGTTAEPFYENCLEAFWSAAAAEGGKAPPHPSDLPPTLTFCTLP